MKQLTIDRFAAMNMVYQRYSFESFLDSLDRLEINNFELWTGAPHLNNLVESLSDAEKVRKQVEQRQSGLSASLRNSAFTRTILRRWTTG